MRIEAVTSSSQVAGWDAVGQTERKRGLRLFEKYYPKQIKLVRTGPLDFKTVTENGEDIADFTHVRNRYALVHGNAAKPCPENISDDYVSLDRSRFEELLSDVEKWGSDFILTKRI